MAGSCQQPPTRLSGHKSPVPTFPHGSIFFHHEAFPGPLHQRICFSALPIYRNPPSTCPPASGLAWLPYMKKV